MFFELSKPIKAHGEEVTSLELSEPTTKDVMELGYPYLLIPGELEGIQLQPKIAGRYISRLAKIPMSSVEQLSINDLQQLQVLIMGFFGE